MKKTITLFLSLTLAVLLLVSPAFAVIGQSEEFYVNDSAGVLSDSLKRDIVSVNGELEYSCKGAQAVVVTVKYLDGMYSDEYAMQLFNDWGVGDADENNGMLLLLATEENKAWLTVGDGINGAFTDDMANKYLDEFFWEDFDNGDFNEAVISLFPQLMYWYESYYGSDFFSSAYSKNSEPESFEGAYDEGYYTAPGIGSLLIAFLSRNFFIIAIIVFLFLNSINRDRMRYRSYYSYMGMPMPPYHFWYMWSGPHRHWHDPRGPRGPRGPGGPDNFGGHSGGSSGGGFGSGGFGGGFGSGGFSGGHSGGGFGGGGFGGGGGGRR